MPCALQKGWTLLWAPAIHGAKQLLKITLAPCKSAIAREKQREEIGIALPLASGFPQQLQSLLAP